MQTKVKGREGGMFPESYFESRTHLDDRSCTQFHRPSSRNSFIVSGESREFLMSLYLQGF